MPVISESKFCSTQINLDALTAQRILIAADMIPDASLGIEGRETTPHLTVQYGIDEDDPDLIRRALAGFGPFSLTLGKTQTFPPSKSSSGDGVLFVSIARGKEHLVAIRNAIRGVCTVTDTHPTYTPHATLAYVKESDVAQYAGKDWLAGVTFEVREIMFSNRAREHLPILLTGKTKRPLGESVLSRIDAALAILGESPEDFSAYRRNPDKFRSKFGDTTVAVHAQMAADFKTRAMKFKKDYEARTHVKAMGAHKHANLRYYFDKSPEGAQYNDLMAASRMHKKVADMLPKSGRDTINSESRFPESAQPENDIQKALFDYERSVAAQDAETWARGRARAAYTSASVLSKNTEEMYYRKYLRDHARSVRFVQRLKRGAKNASA